MGGVVKSIPPIFFLGFELAGARVSPFVRITTAPRQRMLSTERREAAAHLILRALNSN
jgi:hypothetical protein